jgi:opacity protein-like surface antigen
MIGSLMSRMADAEKLSIPQLQKSIQDGIIPAYVGVPLLKDKMARDKAKAVSQQPAQPPIAQQVMAEAAQHGIDAAPSNLPTEMAGGGIVAFDDGGLANEQDEDEQYGGMSDTENALLAKYMAGITADSGSELDEDEEMPEGIMAVMPRENRGVGINPESKGGIGIKDVLAAKAKENKLPPELLNKIAGIESGYKASAANPNSTAKGLFQFTDSTWKSMGGKEGEQFDPEKNAELGAKFVRQNAEGLKGALGRNPTYGEVYASHFFGLKGAKDILNMDPRTPMDQAVSAQVLKANPQLRDKTVGQVMASLNNKMGDGIVSLAGGGVVAFGSPKLNPNEDQLVNDTNDNPYALMGDIGMLTPSYTKDKRSFLDKTLRGIALPPEKPTAPVKPQFNVPPPPLETGPTREELGAGPADMRSEDEKAQEAMDAKIKEREAMGAGDEDITSLREMLTERAKSAKNQKSIDNYMALLQAGLGMMGGTSPYAAANIGQGASKGIAHLADARKSQIAEENALLSGRLGLSRAQLLETSRRNALEQQARRDALNYGLGVQKVKNQTTALDLKRNQLLGKAESDLVKEGEFDSLKASYKERFGKNWERDTLHKAAFEREKLAKIRARASGYADEVEGIPNYNQVK